MDEKELFLKREFNFERKRRGHGHPLFNVIKFVLGIFFLPFVYSTSVSFLKEFALIEKTLQHYFWSGLISFIIIYLFIWEPAIIYESGQRIIELLFIFFKPLVTFASYLLPIYTILLFISYELLSFMVAPGELIQNYVFLFGFSLGMHLVFSARAMQSRKDDFLKINYLFGFSFIYIVNLILFSFFLNLIFAEFSFVDFSNHSLLVAKNIYSAVFKQLFL